jgi:signal peptidase II
MNTKKLLKTILILTILISNIACDQISKNIVRHKIDYNEQISLISKYLTLTKVENTGAFLSLGNSLPQGIKLIFGSIKKIV